MDVESTIELVVVVYSSPREIVVGKSTGAIFILVDESEERMVDPSHEIGWSSRVVLFHESWR